LLEDCETDLVTHGSSLLSKREEEVVDLVADGLTNRQISEQLKLSEHTVKNYLFKVFEKPGISTRVELVRYALSQNHRSDPAIAPCACRNRQTAIGDVSVRGRLGSEPASWMPPLRDCLEDGVPTLTK
jgi:DNA-binding CsgD family transcriptional regulator